MARVIVEYLFEQPVTEEQLSTTAKRFDPCLEIRNGAWRRTSLSQDRRRMICEFEAPDADSVREALRSSGTSFAACWTADVFAVEDYPENKEKLDRVLRARAG